MEIICDGLCIEFNETHNVVTLKSMKGMFGHFTEYFNTTPNIPNEDIVYIPDVINTMYGKLEISSISHSVFDSLSNARIISIPDSIKSIEWSFWQCSKLERIEIRQTKKEVAKYKSVDGVLFSADGKTLYAYPNAHSSKYEVPEGVTTIANCAFKSCESLKELTLPSTLTKIGVNAFYRCVNLKQIICKTTVDKIQFEGYCGEYGNVNPEWYYIGKSK